MLKHHLEYSVVSKYHLFCPQFALHYIALLDYISLLPLEEVILDLSQETGKFKNKIPLRLFNTKVPSVVHKTHYLGMQSWGNLRVSIPACAPWLCDCSHRQNQGLEGLVMALVALSHVSLCFHLSIYSEDPLVVLCFPMNASIQGVMMGLEALMISPCSPHWGPYRCCTSLCNNSLGAKGWGFHLHLKIGEEKCLHHQIPKTLINLSFPIDKADVQWERKTIERGVKGFACCHKAVLGTAKHGFQGIF